jgi:GH18 family chitinase
MNISRLLLFTSSNYYHSINPKSLQKGYDMVAMYPHIDWFNMMSYDIHGSWDDFAGANSDMQYIKNTVSVAFSFLLSIQRIKVYFSLLNVIV